MARRILMTGEKARYVETRPASATADEREIVMSGEKWRVVEEEKKWRTEAKRDRNAKKQKDKPQFPLRVQTLNTTVANLAERLEDMQGKRTISFTPEIDIALAKWGCTGTNDSR